MTEEVLSAKEGRVFERKAYLGSLEKQLGDLIDELPLGDLQRHFLLRRWLDQVLWMEGRANRAKVLYYIFSLTTIVGGVLIPALVNVKLRFEDATFSTWVVLGVSLLVAISAALEGFLRYGEQWRHYRLKVELLKNEGWLFFQLGGRRYHHLGSHAKAFPRFARRVERWNQLEVAEYMTEVAQEKKDDEDDEDDEEEVESGNRQAWRRYFRGGRARRRP